MDPIKEKRLLHLEALVDEVAGGRTSKAASELKDALREFIYPIPSLAQQIHDARQRDLLEGL